MLHDISEINADWLFRITPIWDQIKLNSFKQTERTSDSLSSDKEDLSDLNNIYEEIYK